MGTRYKICPICEKYRDGEPCNPFDIVTIHPCLKCCYEHERNKQRELNYGRELDSKSSGEAQGQAS